MDAPRPLEPAVVEGNLARFCHALLGGGSASPARKVATKGEYVHALNLLQRAGGAQLPVPRSVCPVPHLRCGADACAPLATLPPLAGEVAHQLSRAWALIDHVSAVTGRLMRAVVTAVVVLPVNEERPEGFSRSDAIGVIWVRPASTWRDFDFACTLLHEYVHSTLHLDELVRPLYTVGRDVLDTTTARSSIRGCSRPYDKALHAAVVSVSLAYFCDAAAVASTQSPPAAGGSPVLEQELASSGNQTGLPPAVELRAEAASHIADVRSALPSLLEGSFCCLFTTNRSGGMVYLQQLADACNNHHAAGRGGGASASAHAPWRLRSSSSASSSSASSSSGQTEALAAALARESVLAFARANLVGYGGVATALHGERKVLNKYFPPDFDPSKIPRKKWDPLRVMKIRMMLPMSICCATCGNYMYAGTKFNSRKEDVQGPDGVYLGIKIFRFTIKCTQCSAGCTFLTDPKNADYKVESGCSRNFEMWREKERVPPPLPALFLSLC